MKTTAKLNASSLSSLTDGELSFLLGRVWNRDADADAAVLARLAARGIDPPSLVVLLLAATLERDAREKEPDRA